MKSEARSHTNFEDLKRLSDTGLIFATTRANNEQRRCTDAQGLDVSLLKLLRLIIWSDIVELVIELFKGWLESARHLRAIMFEFGSALDFGTNDLNLINVTLAGWAHHETDGTSAKHKKIFERKHNTSSLWKHRPSIFITIMCWLSQKSKIMQPQ